MRTGIAAKSPRQVASAQQKDVQTPDRHRPRRPSYGARQAKALILFNFPGTAACLKRGRLGGVADAMVVKRGCGSYCLYEERLQ